MGDQGDDRDKIRKMLSRQGIPPRHCRKKPVHYSKRLDRKGHKIENLFSRQKDWRPIATRYDGGAHVFRSAILLAAWTVCLPWTAWPLDGLAPGWPGPWMAWPLDGLPSPWTAAPLDGLPPWTACPPGRPAPLDGLAPWTWPPGRPGPLDGLAPWTAWPPGWPGPWTAWPLDGLPFLVMRLTLGL